MRGCQSPFLTSSSGSVMTPVLTGALEKRGSSLFLVFSLRVPFAPGDGPPAGEEQPCIDAFCCQWPSFKRPSHPIQHLIPSSSLELLPSSSSSSLSCVNSENELFTWHTAVAQRLLLSQLSSTKGVNIFHWKIHLSLISVPKF